MMNFLVHTKYISLAYTVVVYACTYLLMNPIAMATATGCSLGNSLASILCRRGLPFFCPVRVLWLQVGGSEDKWEWKWRVIGNENKEDGWKWNQKKAQQKWEGTMEWAREWCVRGMAFRPAPSLSLPLSPCSWAQCASLSSTWQESNTAAYWLGHLEWYQTLGSYL